jgi:hypothetical protein
VKLRVLHEVGLTQAAFYVWAGQAESGRAEMRSHRWIVNGQHQAQRKSSVTFLNKSENMWFHSRARVFFSYIYKR